MSLCIWGSCRKVITMQTNRLLDNAGPIKIPKIDCSSSKRYGITISCIYCAIEFNNKFKATAHYVLGHRLKYCPVCCELFGNDLDKMTHENRQHWPFQCVKCYAEYTNPLILNDHYRSSHSMQTCSYCEAVLSPSKDGTLIEHLKSKHSVEQLNDLAPTVIWTLITAPGDDVIIDNVKKFHCHLCMQDKWLGSLVSHYQLGHKVDLQKFLSFAVNSSDQSLAFIDNAFVEANAINKKRNSRSVETIAKTIKKIKNTSLNKMVSTTCNFTLVKRLSSSEIADTTLIPTYDYDTNLVQCIASTEDEDDKESESESRVSPLTCQYCLMSLPTFRSLCQHMQKLHGFQLKNTENRCHPCRKVYATLSSLQKHRKKMHESAVPTLKCPFCEEEHNSRMRLR